MIGDNMNWWNIIKQAGGIMSSGSASAGTESETSYSKDLEAQARKDGRIIYRCRFCRKQFNNKPDKDACEKKCLDDKYPDSKDRKLGEFW